MAGVAREAGEEIGGYTVLSTLGRGGSGAVYRVRDGGGGEAALKLVDASADEVAAQRLEREVHALQSLRHPAVPQILDAELDGNETFVVFEYIPGVSLWQHVQDHGPMRGAELADFADRTASALEAVHAAGVVHRDVTPSNIMMGPDGPVLIDFGLSHRTTDERLTRDGLVSGTAGYVAPEVIDGAEPGAIADRWSWAATVAYAMSGQAPFGSGTGAISRTLDVDLTLPDEPGAPALRAALGRDISERPGPRDVVAALRGATTVLPPHVGEAASVGAMGVAPTAVMGSGAAMEADAFVTSGGQPTAVLGSGAAADFGEAMGADGPASVTTPPSVASPADPHTGDIPLAPAPRRPVMLIALNVATASAAALAPFVTFAVMVVSAILVRGVQRRAMAIAASRARRGERRGDAALQTIGLPWHVLRAAGETVPAALLAAVVGGGLAAFTWWLVSAQEILGTEPQAQMWGHAGALMLGGLGAAGALWWGPWMRPTREGAHRVASTFAPTRGVSVAWICVAIAGLAVVLLTVYLDVEPWWWPAPDMPTESGN